MKDLIGKAVGISADRITNIGLEAFLRTFRYDLWTAHQYYLDTEVELVFPLYDPEEGERKIKTATQMTGIKPKSLEDRTKRGVVIEAYPESWARTLLEKSTPMELWHLQREEDEVYKRVFFASDGENKFINTVFGEQERLLTESALNSIQANKTTVVLCELASLFSNRYNLHQRLRDLNPGIFRLIEFDVNK